MKYFTLSLVLSFLLSHVRGQMKGDTTKQMTIGSLYDGDSMHVLYYHHDFHRPYDSVEYRPGKYLLLHLDEEAENVETALAIGLNTTHKQMETMQKRIDSLERRPYLFIDTKPSSSGIWLTNSAGEYQWLIKPFNYR